jgi:hypothetical protein
MLQAVVLALGSFDIPSNVNELGKMLKYCMNLALQKGQYKAHTDYGIKVWGPCQQDTDIMSTLSLFFCT